jgi:hypothetical protein
MRRSAAGLAVTLALTAASPLLAAERWQPTPAETSQLSASVDARWTRLFGTGTLRDRATWNDLAAFAVDGLATGYAPDRVAKALEALAGLQDTDPASPTYGNVRWYKGDAKVIDRNGVEFTTRHLALAWLLYHDRLTDDQRRPLERLLKLAVTGIERHKVAISYTNIFLMKAWNQIALGQILGNAKLSATGRASLAGWLARVRASGVDEYLSPTYYAVDLENLALIENLAADPEAKTLARAGLDIVWGDLALAWYAPGERLGGPHSRDYDRLTNRGGVDDFASRAGWQARGRTPNGPYAAYAYAAPSPATSALLKGATPRFLVARAGEDQAQRLSIWQGDGARLGIATFGYGLHDNVVAANLGAGPDVPTISAFLDGRRDHYGLNRTLEAGSGHLKALHLRPFVAAAQTGPEALVLLSAQDGRPELTSLETTVILPADADYWLDGKPVDLFRKNSAWRPDPAEGAEDTAVTVAARDGRTHLSISDQNDHAGVGLAQRVAVTPGDTLTISAETQGGGAALYLNFEDGNGRLIGGETIKALKPSVTPTRQSLTATAPAGAARVKAWLYSAIANRTGLDVTDLAVERVAAGGKAEPIAGFDFHPFRADDIAVPTGATLTIRRGAAALALRPLGAWNVEGKPIQFHLVNDGLAHGALRLTAMHAETHTDARGTAALWLRVGDGLAADTDFSAFLKTSAAVKTAASRTGDAVALTANGGAGPLAVTADVAAGKRLKLEGASAADLKAAVTIDGKPLAR